MKKSVWELVWCSEHCHKNGNVGLRGEIAAVAEKCVAELVCLKKAAKYASWSSSECKRPFALLSDWREAKPCVQEFDKGTAPIVTLILCDTAQTFRRASAWARHLDSRFGCVHVLSSIADLEPLLFETFRSLPEEADHNSLQAIANAHSGGEDVPQWKSPWDVSIKTPVMESTMMGLIFHCSTQRDRQVVQQLLMIAAPDHYDD
eukprot:CAMPEP_0169119226 /NCGR_PEP_ID=MMETSP1015-20121227/31435_1 /TAXON_ID=342587 /ORGANISM="Karlodinium micrum, Strain CCMP2283" /LENGTH=203 /DNA_ID=CAMNT_0009182075 /DNA_START=127 /DNA_END=738 /DNA_ORIENTATION=+